MSRTKIATLFCQHAILWYCIHLLRYALIAYKYSRRLWYTPTMSTRKNPNAVALGKRGGKKRVPKGFSKMAPERRREIAQKAAQKRWGKE